jgi:hypothetical protein
MSGLAGLPPAGTVGRHGWRPMSPHGWVHGVSRQGVSLPARTEPQTARKPALRSALYASTLQKNNHPQKNPAEAGFFR